MESVVGLDGVVEYFVLRSEVVPLALEFQADAMVIGAVLIPREVLGT